MAKYEPHTKRIYISGMIIKVSSDISDRPGCSGMAMVVDAGSAVVDAGRAVVGAGPVPRDVLGGDEITG